jgi:hypothetical protein
MVGGSTCYFWVALGAAMKKKSVGGASLAPEAGYKRSRFSRPPIDPNSRSEHLEYGKRRGKRT